MAGEVPIAASKKSGAGQTARCALLTQVGIVLPDDLGEAGSAPPDDILDAAAAGLERTANPREAGAQPP
jgi:hypothetical protein